MIFITGDTHAEFNPRLRRKIFTAAAEDYLIICGDFGGVWDGSPRETHGLDWLSDMPFTTLFVSGNHENFNMLAKLPVAEWNGGNGDKRKHFYCFQDDSSPVMNPCETLRVLHAERPVNGYVFCDLPCG